MFNCTNMVSGAFFKVSLDFMDLNKNDKTIVNDNIPTMYQIFPPKGIDK